MDLSLLLLFIVPFTLPRAPLAYLSLKNKKWVPHYARVRQATWVVQSVCLMTGLILFVALDVTRNRGSHYRWIVLYLLLSVGIIGIDYHFT